MRRPIGSALDVVQGIVDELGLDQETPTAEQLAATIQNFERIEFDVPNSADSDGFLFQLGEVNWFSEPTFTVGFVRQLEIVDSAGGHEGYSQVQIEYRYRVDKDLESLRDHTSWWFRGGEMSFGEWLDSMQHNLVWTVVRGKTPLDFAISQELV